MKTFLYLLILLPITVFAQKREDPCEAFERIKKEAKALEEKQKFDLALDKLYSAQIAAKDCNEKKEDEVKKLIIGLFDKVNQLKIDAETAADNAIKEKKRADQKTKEAQIASNNATALYWASESEKIVPAQGLRLIEEALKITNDTVIINNLKGQQEKIFNSNFNNKLEIENDWMATTKIYSDFKSVNKYNWFFCGIVKSDSSLQLWDLNKRKRIESLENEKSIINFSFSPNEKMILILKGDSTSKLYNIASGKYLNLFQNGKNMQIPYFSEDSKYLLSHRKDGSVSIFNIESNTYNSVFDTFKINTIYRNDDRKKYIILHTNDYKSLLFDFDSKNPPDSLNISRPLYNNNFSISQNKEFVYYWNDGLLRYDIKNKKDTLLFKKTNDFPYYSNNISLSLNDKYLIINTYEKSVVIESPNLYPKIIWQGKKAKLINNSGFLLLFEKENTIIKNISTDREIKTSFREYSNSYYDSYSLENDYHIFEEYSKTILYNVNNNKYHSIGDLRRTWEEPIVSIKDSLFLYIDKSKRIIITKIHANNHDYLLNSIHDFCFHENTNILLTLKQNYLIERGKKYEFEKFDSNNFAIRKKLITIEDKYYQINYSRNLRWIYNDSLNTLTDLLDEQNTIVFNKKLKYTKFTEDSKYLTFGTSEGMFIWDLNNKCYDLISNSNFYDQLHFTPNSNWIVGNSLDSTFFYNSVTNLKFGVPFLNFEDLLCKSDNRCYLINKNQIHVWNIEKKEFVEEKKVFLAPNESIRISLSPSQDFLILNYYNNKAINSLSEKYDIFKLPSLDRPINEKKNIDKFFFSSDDKKLFLTFSDSIISFKNTTNNTFERFLKKELNIIDGLFSDDGKYLVIISKNKVITYDFEKKAILHRLFLLNRPNKNILVDNRYLFTLLSNNFLIKTDLKSNFGTYINYNFDKYNINQFTYNEIRELLDAKIFPPLDEEIKQKYGIKDKFVKPKPLQSKQKLPSGKNRSLR